MPKLVALSGFAVGNKVIKRGALIDATDPIVKGRDHLFGPIDDAPVERATAAPGEKRATGRRKPAAKKPAADAPADPAPTDE